MVHYRKKKKKAFCFFPILSNILGNTFMLPVQRTEVNIVEITFVTSQGLGHHGSYQRPPKASALNHVAQRCSNKSVVEAFQKKCELQINGPQTIHLFNLFFGFRREPINLKMLSLVLTALDGSSLRTLCSWNQ